MYGSWTENVILWRNNIIRMINNRKKTRKWPSFSRSFYLDSNCYILHKYYKPSSRDGLKVSLFTLH